MIGRRLALGLPALLLARPAAAHTLAGRAEQGGLLRGEGAAGRAVTLDGRPLRVSPEGRFALGFGRDHGPRATLRVGDATQVLEVAPRQWRVQHITGLPPAQVTPDAAALRRIAAERARLAAARGTDTVRTDFAGALAWPARGRISGVFGSQRVLNGEPRAPHDGLDIAGPVGAPIAATPAPAFQPGLVRDLARSGAAAAGMTTGPGPRQNSTAASGRNQAMRAW